MMVYDIGLTNVYQNKTEVVVLVWWWVVFCYFTLVLLVVSDDSALFFRHQLFFCVRLLPVRFNTLTRQKWVSFRLKEWFQRGQLASHGSLLWESIFWLVVWTPLKNISQLGWLFPIYEKIKIFQTTNQFLDLWLSHWTQNGHDFLGVNSCGIRLWPQSGPPLSMILMLHNQAGATSGID